MNETHRQAFTILELTFVIVIIGILSAIAIPKFAATRDDAVISKARTTVAAVRNSVASERQKRILRGDFANPVTTLNSATATFDIFNTDVDGVRGRVLEYAELNCATRGKTRECWQMNGLLYQFVLPGGATVDFTLAGNRFTCDTTNANCRLLTQ